MIRTLVKLAAMVVFALVLVAGTFSLGVAASGLLFPVQAGQTRDGAPAEVETSMAVFWQAWNIINADFYKQPLDATKMTYGAISGMVDSLGDPHTAFVDPAQAKIVNQNLEGSFEGIGATVEMRDGRLTVVAPIKGSPAEKAGIKPGDIIVKVDDTVIQNMDVNAAIAIIRGPKGTPVKLQVQRGTKPIFTVEIVRDTIPVQYVESRMLEGGIGYLRLSEFSANAPEDLHNQLQQLLAQNPKGLIFDLRSDPGGYLDSAVKIAGEFLPKDSIVLIQKDKRGNRQEFRAPGGGLATEPSLKMVLLVNGGSASASEILAGALQDHKRATLVGTKTFGKGSVQTPHMLSDESQLRVTIAHFFSPNEHEINGVGVQPDIESADPTDAQAAQNQDPQLDRAIQYLNSGAFLPVTRLTGRQLTAHFFLPGLGFSL